MTLHPGVFKAYDVRGLYPGELDEDGAYRIGRGYAEQFEPKRIAVGRDMRVSSPTMAAAFMDGAADAGVDVVDIGLVGTEMLYFAVSELGLDGGATITASHNPKEYTGMKIVRRGALPVGGDSGLVEIRERAERGFAEPAARGEITRHDIYPAFVDRVLSFIDPAEVKPLRVVVDAANGMAGAMLPPILDRLPVEGDPLLLRARRNVSEPRAESAPRGEPRIHCREGARRKAPTSGSPLTATRTAASSSTTPASSFPATSSPRSWPSAYSPPSRARR